MHEHWLLLEVSVVPTNPHLPPSLSTLPVINLLADVLPSRKADLCLPPRLIYWLPFTVGRSFRGFGYSLTFLPLLSMLMWNFYYMFVVEPERMLTASESRLDYPDHARSASDYRPRSWG